VELTTAENKRTQLCLQTELAEENHNHFTHRSYSGERNKQQILSTSRKKKVVTLNVIKKFCMPARNWPEIFGQTSPARPEKPGQTYNSASCQKFHSMSSTCITTQKYI